METFGTVLARVVAQYIMLLEGTMSHWVNIAVVDGNITSISLTPLGESLTYWWSRLAVSFAWSMHQMLSALWSIEA